MEPIRFVRLSEIAQLITKGTTPTTLGFEYLDEGINFLKIESFDEAGRYLPDKITHISEECNEKLKRSKLETGDILFSIAGAIGRVAIVTAEMLPANTNQALAIIRINREDVYLPYIKLILESPLVKKQFEKKQQGVAQLNISLKDINEIELPLPCFEKQVELATLFNRLYEIKYLREKEIEKLDELIKARFVEMFGDPVSNPRAWVKKPLAAAITTANNGMARRGNDIDGDIVMRLVELQDGYIDYSNPNRIKLTEAEKKRYLLIDNDFLFARVNGNPENVGRCSVFYDIGEPVYHNDHIIRVHFDETVLDGTFASALLNSEYGKRQLRNHIKTSAGQYTVSQEGIGAIIAVFPPIHLQKQFAAFVAKVDKSKAVVQKALDKTQVLFDSLMQKFFG